MLYIVKTANRVGQKSLYLASVDNEIYAKIPYIYHVASLVIPTACQSNPCRNRSTA